MRRVPALLLTLALIHWGTANADDIQVGRYLTAENAPTPAQADPLQVTVQLEFPSDIRHVGAALTYLLSRSGYRLQDTSRADPSMRVLLTRPLPEVHRALGPLGLEQALTTLAGPAWRLVIDPTLREISYEAVAPYAEAARARGRTLSADTVRAARNPPSAEPTAYGPIRTGESLRSIAEQLSPGQPVRMAAALFDANPHAFLPARHPDPNRLRTGVELNIPDADAVAQWSRRRARSMLRGER